MTTNDMPIVQPPSLKALNLIPFQINPHYIDPDPNSTHMGETREERLMQYLEENNVIVIGLREGAMLRVGQGTAQLKGLRGARIFSQGQPPYDIAPATALQF
jgi:dipeptidase E